MWGKMNRVWVSLSLCASLCGGAVRAEDAVKVETISSQPCWVLQNDAVRLAVTQKGAGTSSPGAANRSWSGTVVPSRAKPA